MPHLSKACAWSLIALIVLLLCSIPARSAEPKVLFKEDFEKPPGDRWQQVRFGDLTDYHAVKEGTNTCMEAFAKGGASAFTAKLDLQPATNMTFSWRWKIDRCPTNGTDHKAATFDHAGRIFVAFDTLIGPPRAINYVWANEAKIGATFNHPSWSRAKFIAIETGNEKAGQWLLERRDLRKDWELLFKGERMPRIVGIGLFTNSDGTEAPVTGWYDDILLEEE